MWIGKANIDTRQLTFDEVNSAIQELRNIRARMGEARARKENLVAMQDNMKEEGMTLCNKHTGEVFNPDDWLIYDEQNGATYEGKWY